MQRVITLTGMLVLILITSIRAADAPSATPDLSTPKAAITTFYTALMQGDAATVKAAAIADEKQTRMLDALARVMGATKAMHEAAVAKFGKDGEEIGQLPDARLLLEKVQIEQQGDNATAVIPSKGNSEKVQLKKVAGVWKVDVSAMPEARQTAQSIPQMKAMIAVAEQITGEIKAGKYSTAAEAQKALISRMKATESAAKG